jgi:hypothetical protein
MSLLSGFETHFRNCVLKELQINFDLTSLLHHVMDLDLIICTVRCLVEIVEGPCAPAQAFMLVKGITRVIFTLLEYAGCLNGMIRLQETWKQVLTRTTVSHSQSSNRRKALVASGMNSQSGPLRGGSMRQDKHNIHVKPLSSKEQLEAVTLLAEIAVHTELLEAAVVTLLIALLESNNDPWAYQTLAENVCSGLPGSFCV